MEEEDYLGGICERGFCRRMRAAGAAAPTPDGRGFAPLTPVDDLSDEELRSRQAAVEAFRAGCRSAAAAFVREAYSEPAASALDAYSEPAASALEAYSEPAVVVPKTEGDDEEEGRDNIRACEIARDRHIATAREQERLAAVATTPRDKAVHVGNAGRANARALQVEKKRQQLERNLTERTAALRYLRDLLSYQQMTYRRRVGESPILELKSYMNVHKVLREIKNGDWKTAEVRPVLDANGRVLGIFIQDGPKSITLSPE
jgi:hypothetical protein